MKWSMIWELVKVNILYSNSAYLANIRKRQKKKQKARFSVAKEMIRNQVFFMLMMTIFFSCFLLMADYKHYPYLLGHQIVILVVLAFLTSFSAMYSVFYESDDTKNYVPLPIKPTELFVAKVLASLGLSLVYLLPILILFCFAYWQMTSRFWFILLGILNFFVLSVTVLSLSLLATSLIGRYIVRSRHKKFISTILTSIVSFGSIILLLYINGTNAQVTDGNGLAHMIPLPYFRGFVDIVLAPLSSESLLNYWFAIGLTVLLIVVLVTIVMPNYYRDTLYAQVSPSKKQPKEKVRKTSSHHQMIRHHLSTLNHGSLLVQTYSVPFIMIFSSFGGILRFSKSFSSDYFGVAFLVGVMLGFLLTQITSILGVGLSLEKGNYTYLRTLPFSFKGFIKQKFWVLYGVQVLPVTLLLFLVAFILRMSPILFVSLVLGILSSSLLQGQLIYRNDYRHLSLNWQNVNQLFSRGNSQLLTAFFFFSELILGIVLIILAFAVSVNTSPIVTSSVILIMSTILMLVLQLFINHIFWKKVN
ncbi:ABC transporter permease [Streptococcus sciuri]|uniref:ABC transporter permease n=1 Tax=Streptococcus sciuri TaxID=2973939 RepID=A0ABT2F9W7_9STRE|nr:ABC transporter permease [Streptococcus sciuri]MCS4488625.1 ABC transporter permease [Streptococcus sciuri]